MNLSPKAQLWDNKKDTGQRTGGAHCNAGQGEAWGLPVIPRSFMMKEDMVPEAQGQACYNDVESAV